ncbi:MAG: hypothetical protein RLN80_10615, partial [Rhodospirillales bacterium]
MIFRAVFFTSLCSLLLASGHLAATAGSFDETVAKLQAAEAALEKRVPDVARAAVADVEDDVARRLVDWIAY